MDLDQRSMERSGKNRKEWKRLVSPLPEGKAWKDFAPSKIDQRKSSLEHYLQSLLVAPVSDQTDLVNFLASDIVQQKSNRNRKEGYLSKKGQTGFRGAAWKTRYFVLDGSSMKYYESRGGALLGQINLLGAQIGRQHRSADQAEDKNSRYAFLILEAAKKESSQNRHVLSAGSDAERDSWIEMLKRQVVPPPAPPPVITTQQQTPPQQTHQPQQQPPPQPQQQSQVPETMVTQATPPASIASTSSGGNPRELGHQRRRSAVRKSSKDVVVTSAQPMSQLPDANAKFISGAPLPSVINHMESQRQQHYAGAPQIMSTSPQNNQGHPLAPVSSINSTLTVNTDLLAPLELTAKPTKRQSALPGRQSFSPAYLKQLANDGVSPTGPGLGYERDRDRKAKSGRFWGFGKTVEKPAPKPVFGVPLTDSLAIAQVAGLPAIVFRCIEYLEAKNAEQEEGIYRLSGASAVIKGLKERFNHEGDVNLLAQDERWDPHAIAGLLKTYMRELPTSLLTRELHGRFLAVFGESPGGDEANDTDLVDPSARVVELSRLVAELPPANYALLRAFTAHLILIVRNSSINKMTLRNIGIVFSPSLGIPAGIFYELVSRYGAIFDDDGMDELPLDDPAFAGTAVASEAQANQSSPPTLDETAKSKRNSVLYHAGGADAMLGLGGRALDPAAEDSNSEVSISIDDLESEPALSAPSSDNLSLAAATGAGAGRRDLYSPRNDEVEALAHHHNGHP
jgi:RalA-binding protein 1